MFPVGCAAIEVCWALQPSVALGRRGRVGCLRDLSIVPPRSVSNSASRLFCMYNATQVVEVQAGSLCSWGLTAKRIARGTHHLVPTPYCTVALPVLLLAGCSIRTYSTLWFTRSSRIGLTDENVVPVSALANRYEVLPLMDKCEGYMKVTFSTHLTPVTFPL